MVDRDVLAAKLAELTLRVSRVRAHCPASADVLGASTDALDLVAFNLMLAVQCSVDVATHIIAEQRWPTAASLADAFDRLAEHGVIALSTRDSMRGATRIRNIVAQGYAGLDVPKLHDAATRGLAELERLGSEVAVWLASQP